MKLKEWFKKKAAERAEEEKNRLMNIERDIIIKWFYLNKSLERSN